MVAKGSRDKEVSSGCASAGSVPSPQEGSVSTSTMRKRGPNKSSHGIVTVQWLGEPSMGTGRRKQTAQCPALEEAAQGGCGCPIPGGIQGQAGCGSGQPGLVVGDPAHSRGLKLDDHCGPFQPRPFCDSMNMLLHWEPALSSIQKHRHHWEETWP